MGVRYRNIFYSYSGVAWQIDIHDSTYSSSVNLFTSVDGFKLSYKQITERLDPIFASTVNIPIDIINSTIEGFLTDVMTAQEERISVKIYKNTVLYWVGILLPDMVTKEDVSYPYTSEITFTDGLGRLKDIDYNTGGTTPAIYTGRETVLEHLLKILSKTGISALYENYDNFLQTTVNWYDLRHAYLYFYCPLGFTKIDHGSFYRYDDEGTLEYMKTDKVLEYILRLFNARILMAEGRFHVIQPQEYSRSTTFSRVFTKLAYGGAAYIAKSFAVIQDSSKRKSGGTTGYFAPLRKILKTYKYSRTPYENNSMLPLPVPLYDDTPIALLSNLLAVDRIKFSGTIRTWYEATGGTVTMDLWAQFLLRVTATKLSDSSVVYLTSTNDVYSWSSTPASCAYKVGPYVGGSQWDEEFKIEFTLPILTGVEYSATFQFYFNGLFTGPGFPYTLQAGESWEHEIFDFKLIVDNSDGESLFTAVNTAVGGTPVASNLEIKLPDTLLGDGPLGVSLGRLTTSNLTAYADSTVWGIHNSLTKVKINQLSVDQNLLGQRLPTEKYQGAFVDHTISAVNSICWGSRILVPMSLIVFPVSDEVAGEWFNVMISVMGGAPTD